MLLLKAAQQVAEAIATGHAESLTQVNDIDLSGPGFVSAMTVTKTH